jgi:hypothetical protein
MTDSDVTSLEPVPLVDLWAGDLDWTSTTLPGSAPEVELARLHVDPVTRARVSLVRFPDTWRRPGTGHYPCAEELLVLHGAITVSGMWYAAGEYGYLPPYATRTASATPEGCVALAWFSGAPRWIEGTAEEYVTHEAVRARPAQTADRDTPLVPERPPRPGVPGSSRLVGRAPTAVWVPTELVFLADWWWAMALPGRPVPNLPGPVLVRRWP